MNHELSLIKSFVNKERQERFVNLIATKKGRNKFRVYIALFKDINSKYCHPLPRFQSYEQLRDFLKSEGASDTCYIIS